MCAEESRPLGAAHGRGETSTSSVVQRLLEHRNKHRRSADFFYRYAADDIDAAARFWQQKFLESEAIRAAAVEYLALPTATPVGVLCILFGRDPESAR